MKLEKEGLVVTPLTEQKTGLWDMAFIWFCANVAVPRLMIGGSLAELGFGKMILILIAGNILVFLPLLALGVIGFNVRIPTMAATRMTFGVKGSYLPSVANGIQLLGWGANVTVICGASINSIIKAMTGFENLALWIVVTGIVQLVITAYGVRSITWLQRVSVPLLAILTVVSAILIIKNYGWSSITNYQPVAAIGLLAGLDIVASNAFAWGPMVCDYTRYAKSKSSSSWGTLIGSLAGAAGFMFVGGISYMATGNANPVDMLLSLGLGIPALLIIVLSSVTTNVMNLYSASHFLRQCLAQGEALADHRHRRHRYDRYRADPQPHRSFHQLPHHRRLHLRSAYRYHAGRLLPHQETESGSRGNAGRG